MIFPLSILTIILNANTGQKLSLLTEEVSYENRWTLNNETLMNYKIPLPSAEETIKIATFLDSKTAQIDAIIDNTKQSIIEFKKYKQTLITEIVSKGLNPDIKMAAELNGLGMFRSIGMLVVCGI